MIGLRWQQREAQVREEEGDLSLLDGWGLLASPYSCFVLFYKMFSCTFVPAAPSSLLFLLLMSELALGAQQQHHNDDDGFVTRGLSIQAINCRPLPAGDTDQRVCVICYKGACVCCYKRPRQFGT
mgnify:CR=1 FL=1